MCSARPLKAALLAAPLAANAHYIFSQLIVNGEAIRSDYSYIRQNTNSYMPSFTDDVINSEDMRCNVGATNAASETYDVNAGDTIGFKLAYDEFIEHPGPGFVYMSLVRQAQPACRNCTDSRRHLAAMSRATTARVTGSRCGRAVCPAL